MSPAPGNRYVIRSIGGLIATGVAVLIAAYFIIDAGLRAGWGTTMLWVPWILLLPWVTYVAMASSTIAVDDDGATVQNLLRRYRMPWARVTDVEMRMQLTFHLDSRKPVVCMGGPSVARPGQQVTRMGKQKQENGEATVQGLLQRWSAGRHRDGAQGPVTASWDWLLIGSLALILVWAAVATLLANA
ncbi:PH domain-containing protein [Microbacterium gorillae]|uniref:PH domain-containing protein n=1 Tax=Microbacterium gorillae TaxID=1231063 RepID=UPI00114269EB|nr:PH domain-containing protein [Microbacterium gorillae]